MDATEICPLTREAVGKLLRSREEQAPERNGKERRRAPRWPFPGTTELWVPDADGVENYVLATCLDLGERGIGIRCDEMLPVGLELALAIHQPEVSFHGRAVVRHSTATPVGDHIVGLEFLF